MNEHLLTELLEKAQYHEDHGLWLAAAQYYLRILDALPERTDVTFRLSAAYARLGNLRAAEQVLLNALGRDRSNADILFELASLFTRAENPDRALYYLEQLVPYRLPRAHYSIAILQLQRGDVHAADRHLTRVVELDPVFGDAPLLLADVLVRSNQSFRAVSVLRDALANGYDDWRYAYMFGVALSNLRRWDEALEAFRGILVSQPDNADVLLAAANICIAQRQLDDADDLLRNAESAAPLSPAVLTAKGTLALLKAEKHKARSFFLRALEIDPTFAQALESMQYFEREQTSHS